MKNERSVFMKAFKKKSQNLLKVKKKYDQFLTHYASRLLQPIYLRNIVIPKNFALSSVVSQVILDSNLDWEVKGKAAVTIQATQYLFCQMQPALVCFMVLIFKYYDFDPNTDLQIN